jgi:hypothetical protein
LGVVDPLTGAWVFFCLNIIGIQKNYTRRPFFFGSR